MGPERAESAARWMSDSYAVGTCATARICDDMLVQPLWRHERMADLFFGDNAIWFSAIAFAGTAIFLLRLLLMLVGVGDLEGGDFEAAVDGDPSIGLLSINGIAGILMGFGFGALISYRSLDWGFLASIGVGIVAGLAVGWLIVMMFQSMKRMESSGTVDASAAVGNTATVYTAIPNDPNQRGRVRVVIDGRMRYYPARSESGAFPRGAQVHVRAMDDDRTIVVQSLSAEPDGDQRMEDTV